MTYLERLSPWCIVKLLPNMQRQIVARCRRRNDAEEHLRILHRLLPGATFAIIFDPGLEPQDLPIASNSFNHSHRRVKRSYPVGNRFSEE